MKLTIVGTTQLATALALAALLSSEAEASKKFVKLIPNGGNVPNTPAIGHPDGTGDDPSTNAFGDAFFEAGNKWTKELCEADTDGDGQTNGQELGDPCCEWDMDTNPVVQWTTGVSHPSDASKTSDPSLWANLCGASESTAESSSTTDAASTSTESTNTASATTEPTDTTGSGATTSETNASSDSSSAKDSDKSHSHGSDMHDSSMSSSNSSTFASGSTSTSGSSSSSVDVGSPSTSSDSSQNAIRGSSESSAASSNPSTSSSGSSAPASSGVSAVKPIMATVVGVVAVAMAFVA
ncbi:hypothetical protein V7S43_011897 [Phytophthora oleae]|uniref:Temptin Cys/Cys disulfide domain-containing protein n=1 Tax=Phytophthora oleae TaxID=2107226 RepID=A0ABD3FB63_9STRA